MHSKGLEGLLLLGPEDAQNGVLRANAKPMLPTNAAVHIQVITNGVGGIVPMFVQILILMFSHGHHHSPPTTIITNSDCSRYDN